MNNQTNNEEYIDLSEIVGALLRRIVSILLTTVLFGAAGFLYSRFIATPLYSAEAMMIVNAGQSQQEYVSTDQLRSAASLVDTYSIIIKSDTVLNQVMHRLGMDQDAFDSEIKDISVDSVDETQVMRITVKSTDAQTAVDVCSEITSVAPDAIVDMVEAGSVRLVSQANSSFRPVSPNILRNTIVAAMIGFLLMTAYVVIRTLMDNKIKSEADITAINLPILGVIPTYQMEDER